MNKSYGLQSLLNSRGDTAQVGIKHTFQMHGGDAVKETEGRAKEDMERLHEKNNLTWGLFLIV